MKFLPLLEQKLNDITPANYTNKLQDEIIDCFQKAVLCGEYILSNHSDEVLYNIGEKLNALAYIADKDIKAPILKILNRFFDPFRALCDESINNLQLFAEGKESITIDTRRFQYYRLKLEIYDALQTEKKPDSQFNIHELLFQINLLLAYMDEQLESNKAFIHELSSIRSFLNTKVDSKLKLSQILNNKAEYLELKIKYSNLDIQDELINLGIEFPSLESPDDNAYNKFDQKTKKHLSDISLTSFNEQISRFEKETDLEQLQLESFHLFNAIINRRLKNDGPDVEVARKYKAEIDECINKIATKLSITDAVKGLTLINKIALESIKKSLTNTSIRLQYLLIEKESFAAIHKTYKKYVLEGGEFPAAALGEFEIQLSNIGTPESGIRDVYCYLIFLEFLNKLIYFLNKNSQQLLIQEDVNLDKKPRDERKGRIDEIITRIKQVYGTALKELKANFKILSTHRARPAYLCIQDCLESYELKDEEGNVKDSIDLFLYSSYTLPGNPAKEGNKISGFDVSYHAQIISLQNTFENAYMQAEYNNKLAEYDNRLVQLDKKAKENEFRTVQIIAMFVSIATFVLLNVKIFDGKTGLESFAIILGLSACFFVFNLFFYFTILSQYQGGLFSGKNIARSIIFILIPVSLAYKSYQILSNEDGKGSTKLKEMTKRVELDSVRIDSQIRMVNELDKKENDNSYRQNDFDKRLQRIENR